MLLQISRCFIFARTHEQEHLFLLFHWTLLYKYSEAGMLQYRATRSTLSSTLSALGSIRLELRNQMSIHGLLKFGSDWQWKINSMSSESWSRPRHRGMNVGWLCDRLEFGSAWQWNLLWSQNGLRSESTHRSTFDFDPHMIGAHFTKDSILDNNSIHSSLSHCYLYSCNWGFRILWASWTLWSRIALGLAFAMDFTFDYHGTGILFSWISMASSYLDICLILDQVSILTSAFYY